MAWGSWTGFWISLAALALVALLVMLALRLLGSGRRQPSSPLPQAASAAPATDKDRMLGLALQAQGQLDLAFEHFQRAPRSPALQDNLKHLAQAFERKQQFKQAQAVLHYWVAPTQGTTPAHAADLPVALPGAPVGLQSGDRLGRYQVGKVLGKGAMGVVYLGQDTQANRVVALKTMALGDEFEGDHLVDARERFFREAQTAGRLHHPHIVTIHESGEDQGLAFIAMEFIQGQDLMAYCKRDHLLAPQLVVSIAARVAEALACAHAQHVVHRDIKPANVMYDIRSDTLKVTDFGIARITDANKTRTGLVLGTPSFMSPEQLAGKKVDGRSDLYSLGVMLFYMLTGTLPFRATSMAALMHKITHEPAPDLRSLRPDLPPALAAQVAQALEKLPQARYQDGVRMASDLRALSWPDKTPDPEN